MTIYELYNEEILIIANYIADCFRWLGWVIIKVFAWIVGDLEKAVNKIYTLNSFFESQGVQNLIDKYKPIMWSFFAISLAIIGFKIMFNKAKNREEIPSNILFAILIVTLLPTVMIKLNDITKLAVKSINVNSSSLSKQLIKNNLYDIYYLDEKNFDLENDENKNNIPSSKILSININERIDESKVGNEDILKNKVVQNSDGEQKTEKLEKNLIMEDEAYYRYSIDFLPTMVAIGGMAIALICTLLKVIRLLIELGINQMFAMLLAYTDIDDGKRLKEVIKHIISIFVVIFATAIMLKFYLLFNVWIEDALVVVGLGSNELVKIVCIIAGAITIIDGPNIMERILGIDVGLKSSWGTVMAGYGAVRGMMSAGKTVSGMATSFAGGAATAAAGAAGFVKGQFDKNKSNNANLGNKDTDKDDKSNSNNLNDNELKNSKIKANNEGQNIPGVNDKDSVTNKDSDLKNTEKDNINKNNPNESNSDTPLNGQDTSNENSGIENNKETSGNDKFNIISNKDKEGLIKNKDNSGINDNGNNLADDVNRSKNNNSNEDRTNGNINKDNDNSNLGEEVNKNKPNINDKGINSKINEDTPNGNENKDKSNINEDISKGNSRKENSNVNSKNINNLNDENSKDINGSKREQNNTTEEVKGNNSSSGNTSDNDISDNKNSGYSNDKNTSGRLEQRTLGEYAKDKFLGLNSVDRVTRAYSIGYNTASKWNIKGKKNKNKDNEIKK